MAGDYLEDEEREQALAWMEKEAAKRFHNYSYPDRESREPNATTKQLEYIRHLLPGIDEKVLASLGKWQASGLIDEIKYQKQRMTQELFDEWEEKQHKKQHKKQKRAREWALLIFWGLLCLIILWGFFGK